jgi:hypothetical protein
MKCVDPASVRPLAVCPPFHRMFSVNCRGMPPPGGVTVEQLDHSSGFNVKVRLTLQFSLQSLPKSPFTHLEFIHGPSLAHDSTHRRQAIYRGWGGDSRLLPLADLALAEETG